MRLAKTFKSTITLTSSGKSANAKSLILLLGLGVTRGTMVEVSVEGEDEREALSALVSLIEQNFPE